jgi:hypothetical protein
MTDERAKIPTLQAMRPTNAKHASLLISAGLLARQRGPRFGIGTAEQCEFTGSVSEPVRRHIVHMCTIWFRLGTIFANATACVAAAKEFFRNGRILAHSLSPCDTCIGAAPLTMRSGALRSMTVGRVSVLGCSNSAQPKFDRAVGGSGARPPTD